MENTLRKAAITLSKEAAFVLMATIGAVILPQVFHGVGVWFGVGGALGQSFLPMYLPVLLIGFLRGKVSGLVSGLLAPLVSFAVTGMPGTALLPFITLELAVSGLTAGVLREAKIPAVLRVLSVQVIAKAVRLTTFAIAFGVMNGGVTMAAVFDGVPVSLPGVALQLVLIPLVIRMRGRENDV